MGSAGVGGGSTRAAERLAPTVDVGHAGLEPFWRAAVRLHHRPQHPGGAEDAAAVLCDLARSQASGLIASVLRIDLASSCAGWTVACYEIGDTTPSALHEHHDPVTAISALMECTTPSHIASELICNGEGGLQWVALTRARSRVRFQLPDELNTSARRSTQVNVAMRGWRDQLDRLQHLDRPATPPAVAQVRAPLARDVAGVDVSDTPLAPSVAPQVRPAPMSDPAPAPVQDLWAHAFDDDGLSRAALAALGLVEDEPLVASPTAPPTSAGGIDVRTLNTAMRTALAGAVPYLEQYLMDAVAERIAGLAVTATTDGDDGDRDELFAEVRRGFGLVLQHQQELASEIRSLQVQHLSAVMDLNARIRRLEATGSESGTGAA